MYSIVATPILFICSIAAGVRRASSVSELIRYVEYLTY
ncbi:hypothetical protein BH18ACT7_BH18ACT7_23890 [soil metagenome]